MEAGTTFNTYLKNKKNRKENLVAASLLLKEYKCYLHNIT